MATQSKCREAIFPSIGLVFFFIIANLAFAETKVFLEEYTYQAGEADSRLSSRVIALEQIKRLLLEKLGTYLESATEVKNLQLTKDQIAILTAGIVSAEIIDERWDGKTYYLKAKITADPQDVIKSIGVLRHDRQKTKELEETRKKADEALREVERLKKELNIAKAGKTEQDRYNKAVNKLRAAEWVEKGWSLVGTSKWQEAIESFTKAIQLEPTYVSAYAGRGAAYLYLKDYQQVIKDLDRAIGINPSGNAILYVARGQAHLRLGNHRQAIRDYDKAIKLDPKDSQFWATRGSAYSTLKDYQQAIKDYDKAIELDPKDAQTLRERTRAYEQLEGCRQAIKDLDEHIGQNPKDGLGYRIRALAYRGLGDRRHALEDYKIAARLGDGEAQDYLRSQGVGW